MSHILDIIIKATDQATQTTTKVKESIKNMGDSTTAAGGKFEGLKNKVTSVTGRIKEKWKNMSSEMKMAIGAGLTAAGAAVTNFLKSCVTSTKEAEKGWIAYKNSLQVVSGQTVTDTNQMKQAVVDMANQTGRSTADVRTAMTNLMNKGLDFATAQKAAYAASGMAAAGLASDEASASNMIVQALNGRGMALKKLGININDYKDSVTGQIDTERLLTDITNKTKGAQEEYANSSAAVSQRLENSWGALKTSIGSVVLQALEPLVQVLTVVVGWFNQLPGPIKTVVAGALMLVAGFAMVAGPLISLIELLKMLRDIEILTTIAQWALNASAYANPYVLLAMAILALIAALVYLYYNNEQVRQAVDKLAATIKEYLIGAFNYLCGVIDQVVSFFEWLWSIFTKTGSNTKGLVNTVLQFFGKLPGKVWNYLKNVGTKLISAGANWLNSAKNAGLKIVNGVTSGLSGLADAVWGKFKGVASAINNAASSAVSAASDFGSRALKAFKSAINSASPSDFYKIPYHDFNAIAGVINDARPKAVRAVSRFGKEMINAYDTDFGIDNGFSLDTDLSRNSNLKVNQKVTVEHDFSHLPDGVSAEEVARIVNKTAGSETFARTLANNQVFQSADSTMKNRINKRVNRLGGV